MKHGPIQGGSQCPIFPLLGRRAALLCDGPPPAAGLLAFWLDGTEIFVCADGAGHPFSQLPRPPDIVIGDMDSVQGRVVDRLGPRYLRDPNQETTDSEKALLYLEQEGYEEVVLLGAAGWRLDHTLYNCLLMEKFSRRMRICLAGHASDTVRLGKHEMVVWDLEPGTPFSLLPAFGTARGLTVKGARYELDDARLGPISPSAVSNQVTQPPLRLHLEAGSLLVSVQRAGWFAE